jgi:hypothetical protein
MNDTTIIYYTSNREDEALETRIQQILRKMSGDIPIVSVSQKPIDFGTNVCVGDVGANDHNLYRQIQIACQTATTPFVLSAEADNLYPPDYFTFQSPELGKIYRYKNIWILKYWRTCFVKKKWCEGAQLADREYLLRLIDEELKGKPMWMEGKNTKTNPFRNLGDKFPRFGEGAVISLKTGNGLRPNTLTDNSQFTRTLPYWGSVRTVRRKLNL